MNSYGILVVAFFLVFANTGCDDSAAANQALDRELIVGKWQPFEGARGGEPMRGPFLNNITLSIDINGMYTITKGTKKLTGHLDLAQDKEPKQMTMRPHTGQNEVIRAVYELKGDTLVVCYEPHADFYPYKIECPKGSNLYLAKYKRIKE